MLDFFKNKKDRGQLNSFLGTAIGTGLLYLPLEATQRGFFSFFLSCLIAFPFAYFSLYLMTRLQMSSKNPLSFNSVITSLVGKRKSVFISLGYFFIFISLLSGYSKALCQDVFNLVSQQVDYHLLSFFVLGALVLVVILGERFILKIMELLTTPLVIILLLLSVLLIPYWDFSSIWTRSTFNFFDLLKSLFILVPLICFSILYYPTLSSMILSYREEEESEKIIPLLKLAQLILSGLVFFFISSFILALGPEEISYAQENNISVIPLIGPKLQGLTRYLAPFIGLAAISSSFIGVFIGAREGMGGLLEKLIEDRKKRGLVVSLLIFIFLYSVAVVDFRLESLLGLVIVPLLAFIFFIFVGILILQKDIVRLKREKIMAASTVIFGLFLLFSYFVGTSL